jgi:Transglutaminase-like superfamily
VSAREFHFQCTRQCSGNRDVIGHLVGKFMRLPADRQADLLRAVWHLARARVRHLIQPSHVLINPALSPPLQAAEPAPTSRFDPLVAGKVAAAIETAAGHVPWRSDCLIQAMAATDWLKRLGFEPRLKIGMKRSEAGEMLAHAWLELDGEVIVGGRGQNFADYAIFRRPA